MTCFDLLCNKVDFKLLLFVSEMTLCTSFFYWDFSQSDTIFNYN